jgi:CheY-like chemotaxis protein
VEIDRAGLEQVVTNLLVNAAHAAGTVGGGHVWLTGSRVGSRYLIVVEDDGPGISSAIMPHIFEPFFTTKPLGQGTGLGLSVSLGIVEQYGGTLRASDLGVGGDGEADRGKGARFVVELPVSPFAEYAEAELDMPQTAPAAPGPVERAAVLPPAVADAPVGSPITLSPADTELAGEMAACGCRVLVVDDEDVIRRSMRRYLERRGCKVDEAPNGEAALAMLLGPDARDPYDMVICDLNMPRMSGMALHERLEREAPHILDVFVIATGDVVAQAAAEFLERTRCPVLEKPFELRKLGEQVAARVRARASLERAI